MPFSRWVACFNHTFCHPTAKRQVPCFQWLRGSLKAEALHFCLCFRGWHHASSGLGSAGQSFSEFWSEQKGCLEAFPPHDESMGTS